MTDYWNDKTVIYVRGTNGKNDEQAAYKCAGMATAQAKVSELRMSGFKDVVMSVSDPNGGSAADVHAPLYQPASPLPVPPDA